MLLRIMSCAWMRFIFLLWLYCFYSQTVYATCTGLGCSCSAGTTAVAFGSYNPLSVTAVTANGNVAVTCNALVIFSVSYVISMNTGNSPTFSPRFMNLSGTHLNYNLYTTAGLTTIWGDGTAGTGTISDSYTAVVIGPVTMNYPVFGQLPALQVVGAGTYTDTVVVTVTY